jgi:uncharacterized phage protein (TIGR01671 family)
MREIKFRAYDVFYNKFVYSHEIGLEAFWRTVKHGIEAGREVPVSQFTGLHDKNGHEIFEGDIFMDEEDGSYNFVEWDSEYGGWTTNQWFTPMELAKEARTLEVIGNIYENPHLLDHTP